MTTKKITLRIDQKLYDEFHKLKGDKKLGFLKSRTMTEAVNVALAKLFMELKRAK